MTDPVAARGAADMTEADARAAERARVPLKQKAPLLLALVLLWMMLWGSVTPLTVLTGLVVALVVTQALYLPPVVLSGRFNAWWMLVFSTFAASMTIRSRISGGSSFSMSARASFSSADGSVNASAATSV